MVYRHGVTTAYVIGSDRLVDRLSLKPYLEEDAVKFNLELLAVNNPDLREKIDSVKPSQFSDTSLLKELEAEGFFTLAR